MFVALRASRKGLRIISSNRSASCERASGETSNIMQRNNDPYKNCYQDLGRQQATWKAALAPGYFLVHPWWASAVGQPPVRSQWGFNLQSARQCPAVPGARQCPPASHNWPIVLARAPQAVSGRARHHMASPCRVVSLCPAFPASNLPRTLEVHALKTALSIHSKP